IFFWLRSCLRSHTSWLLDFEVGNHLRLPFVENLKIFLVKISDSVSLAVADDCAHQHQLYVDLEGGGFVVRSEFCRILLNLRLRGRGLSWRLRGHLLLRKRRTCTNEEPNRASEKMPTPV